ncbi:MAG: peptide ABC transporter substrate-binding protein [Tepidiformaceae bacterium]
MSRSKLRLVLGLFAVFAALAISVACGDDDDNTATPAAGNTTASGTTPAAGTPNKGGEVTVQHRPFRSFDPHFTAFGRDISQQGMVFRGLYKLDKDDKMQPELAAEMPKISSDGKTYTIKMKPGLKWSDGAALTAKDAVAAFQRTCNPDIAGQYSANLFNIVGCEEYYTAAKKTPAEKDTLLKALGVKQIDDSSLEIKVKEPQATFAIQLALWFSWPLPAHLVKAPGDPWPTDPTQLVFSGPFKVQSYKEKDNLVLVRNDNYAGPHLAYLDKITLRYIEDLETANNAYRNNELLMSRANQANLDVLRSDPKLGKEITSAAKSPSVQGLTMLSNAKPLDNAKLRLALSQATDRNTLNKVVLKDANIPTTTWIPGDLIGVKTDVFEKSIGYSPENAKKSFADSGVGKDVKITLTILDDAQNKDIAAFLKEQWSKTLGIDLQVEIVDSPTLQKKYEDEKYQLIIQGWTQDYPDAENWVDGLFNTGGPNNHYGCSDTKLDDLLKKAKANLNEESRKGQYLEMNKLIAENICGMAPLYQQRIFYLVSPKLKGAADFSTSQDRYLAGDWAVEEWYLTK